MAWSSFTLTGTVSYGIERAAAGAVAGLAGVCNVWNDVEIGHYIDLVDADLHVQQALDHSALVPDGSDVKADTKDNVITLTRPCPHLGRTRRNARRRADGPQDHRRLRQPPGHRLTVTNVTRC